MKRKKQGLFAVVVLVISGIILVVSAFLFSLTPVSSSTKEIEVVIKEGSGVGDIARQLKDEHIIRSKNSFQIYALLTGKRNLQAGTYSVSQDMGIPKIISLLNNGKAVNTKGIKITFKEGISIPQVVSIIEKNTGYSQDDINGLLSNQEYLDELISQYWFLTDDIKNEKIYYPLEGYLYPDTYMVNKDSELKDIIKKILDNTNNKLEKYKSKIEESNYSIHELLSLASIVELEGFNNDDRRTIAGVFMNRLKDGMSLGSDVTTYYGARVDMGDRDLTKEELDSCNDYNTRCDSFNKIPVSPICNVSTNSLEAVLKPDNSDYYYFVADKNKDVYFTKTYEEHIAKVQELKNNNLYYTYDEE